MIKRCKYVSKNPQGKKRGKVYLIGAGPAGRDLITVRGLRLLKQADVVVYDYLIDQDLLLETKPDAELINCRDLGKDQQGTKANSQVAINTLVIAWAKKGKVVVRLKNGDPMIFGRVTEELEALNKERIPYEIVPGVSAAQVAAAYCGIPLTDRETASSVVFVTGHEARRKKTTSVNWGNIAVNDTIVVYMGVGCITRIARDLIAAGRKKTTPVAAVANVGRMNQRLLVSRLNDIAADVKKEGIAAPAIFIIGETVFREKDFNWFKKDQRIWYTGMAYPELFSEGTVFQQALIKIEQARDYAEFDRQIQAIREFHWLLFTSRHSVQYFFERLTKTGFDSRVLFGVKIATIGRMTEKRLLDFGIKADLVPQEESSQGLLAAFCREDLKGKRILFPRSNIANKDLPRGLEAMGATVVCCEAYRNVFPEDLPDVDLNLIDIIVFTSPSGIRNFLKRYGRPPQRVQMDFIGEVTRAEARKSGLIKS